jgi:hypothetical protein
MNTAFGSKNREVIYAALYSLLTPLLDTTTVPIPDGKFRHISRRVRHWEEMDDADMPSLMMSQQREKSQTGIGTGLPYKWKAEIKLYVYAYVGNDESATPTTQLNALLDAIETAVAPSRQGERQTLGGVCHDCRIVGDIETDEGTLGTHAVAMIPIEILA